MEMITDLRDDTVEALQDLVQITQDSSDGFTEAAEVIDNEFLTKLFTEFAEQRKAMSDRLSGYLELNSEDADNSGSWKAKFHRWWLDLRGKLSGGDAYAVLAEAERGEDEIKAVYEDLIKQTTGNPVNDVLHEQYVEIVRGHDRIRDLRDAYKAMKE